MPKGDDLDYERILRLYLAHVINRESVDLIDTFTPPAEPLKGLTDEEMARLRELSEEAWAALVLLDR